MFFPCFHVADDSALPFAPVTLLLNPVDCRTVAPMSSADQTRLEHEGKLTGCFDEVFLGHHVLIAFEHLLCLSI